MRELAEKNQQGVSSSEEQEELQNYVVVGHMLAVLNSKARRSLKVRDRTSLGSTR